MNKRFILSHFFIFSTIVFQINSLFAQNTKITREEYIDTYKNIAISEMIEHGVPASIKLAQAILESGDGNSALARQANNHFGIKCHLGWEGEKFIQDDDAKDECFRVYDRAEQSFRDHTQFLKTRRWYASLFELDKTDYKSWAHGLKKAGYATNPKYPELLIGLIERHQLYEYDLVTSIADAGGSTKTQKKEKEDGVKREMKHNINADINSLEVRKNNDVKYVLSIEGDTPYKIAKELNMMLWQIYKYNDLGKRDQIQPGTVIYIQPKRNRSRKHKTHTVERGQTMYTISQKYGVKYNKLLKFNPQLKNQVTPNIGETVYLRRAGLRGRMQDK